MKRLVDFMNPRPDHEATPRVKENVRLYVVGDIHGRSDLLAQLHASITKDAQTTPENTQNIIVYLGDYIDLGPDSFGVIDLFVSQPLKNFEQVFLMGNHELSFINFIKGEGFFANWINSYGGDKTLESYGVDMGYSTPYSLDDLYIMRNDLMRKIPEDHLTFLQNLHLSYECGDYFCVHAGIDPDRDLYTQRPRDMVMIRDRFLTNRTKYEKIIIHGHTIAAKPEVRNNRINLDTGAYESGILSVGVFEGAERRLIQIRDH